MAEFCRRANLPYNAEKIIIGERYKPMLESALEDLSVEVLPLPPNPYVDWRLSSHADLSIFHPGGHILYCAPYLKNTGFTNFVQDLGIKLHFCTLNQGEKYPEDAAMNVCALENSFIYHPKVSSVEIISALMEQGSKGISCKQGYCKCSVCIVDENSIISSDKSICDKMRQIGFDVLQIEPGNIKLDGFEYGFIGGASFKIRDDILAFTGTLDRHPDKNRIIEFLYNKSIMPVFLTNETVFDIGSAVCLTEKRAEF